MEKRGVKRDSSFGSLSFALKSRVAGDTEKHLMPNVIDEVAVSEQAVFFP